MEPIDLVIHGIAQLATMAGDGDQGDGPARGDAMLELGLIEDAVVLVRDERIVWVGPASAPEAARQRWGDAEIIDARGQVGLPGFVDPHTHLVFAGSRAGEFDQRIQGLDYLEIARRGGGILSSVRSLRDASREELLRGGRRLLDRLLASGTTTVEIKSGYGLTTADELRSLEVIAELGGSHAVDVVPTFLGAHAVPPEFAGRADAYVDLVVGSMLPEVRRQGIARFCDVFCEPGFFDRDQSRRVLEAGRDHGLELTVHADEFEDLGGAALAAELGALSADHLMAMGDDAVDVLLEAPTIPTLLPGTSFFLGMKRFARGRWMIDRGLPVALATDLNPGSSMIVSMPLVLTLACLGMQLRPAEALVAATRNAAHAVGLGHDRGCLTAGRLADIQLLDLPSVLDLPYQVGASFVTTIVKRGRRLVPPGAPAPIPSGG